MYFKKTFYKYAFTKSNMNNSRASKSSIIHIRIWKGRETSTVSTGRYRYKLRLRTV
jgi:hypothetical protein